MRKMLMMLMILSPVPAFAGVVTATKTPDAVPVPPSIPVHSTPVPTLPQTRQELQSAPSQVSVDSHGNTVQSTASAPALPPLPPEKSLYDTAEKSLLPLKPEDLMKFRKRLQATQEASEKPIAPPLARTKVITVYPNRGGIPVIPMAAGYVTDVSFVDEWGQPWHVSDATVGNGAAFQVVNPTAAGGVAAETALEDKQGKITHQTTSDVATSTIIVAAKQKFRDSNLSVLLHQLPTPLLFNLETGNHQVDYRIIVRVDALPAGSLPPVGGITGRSHDSADAVLMRALYDTMPQSARPVPFGYGEAWFMNGKIWLRTRYSVLSPAWIATMQSPDGVHAYELPSTATAMLSIHGEPQTIVFESSKGDQE